MSLMLMGFQGVGKTTLGRTLARHFKLPFFDTDELILRRLPSAKSCKEIVEREGIAHFRALEKGVIHTLSPHIPSVIALGGGAIVDVENVEALKHKGRLVYLKMGESALKQRFRLSHTTFEAVFAERKTLFEKCADVTVDVEKECLEIVLEPFLKL